MYDTNKPLKVFQRAGFVLFLLLSLPNVAAADLWQPVFISQMICDTDGVAPFTDVKGNAAIFDNGDLWVDIARLRPNTAYTCLLACNVGGIVVTAPCSTNSRGRLTALLRGLGRSDGMATGCGQPVVTVFTDDPNGGDFCEDGYGSP